MSKMSHTPGPWVLHPTALHPAVRSVGTDETGPRRICTVGTMNGNPVDKENARLIAAAPDLLEALQNIIDSVDKGHAVILVPLAANARAAIAKATRGDAA